MTMLKRHEEIIPAFLAAIQKRPQYKHVDGDPLMLFEVRPDFTPQRASIRELSLPLSPEVRERAANALRLPIDNDRTRPLWAEVAAFCPVPLINHQKRARQVLEDQARHWLDELDGARRLLNGKRLQPVPFARFLLPDEGPDDWVRIEQVEVDGRQFVDGATDEQLSRDLCFLIRPFIAWAVDATNPFRHVALTDGGAEVAITRPRPREDVFQTVYQRARAAARERAQQQAPKAAGAPEGGDGRCPRA